MSEYSEVEQPFLDQLSNLGWTSIDQGSDIPQDPEKSLRQNFRQWLLPEVFNKAIAKINSNASGKAWLTQKRIKGVRVIDFVILPM